MSDKKEKRDVMGWVFTVGGFVIGYFIIKYVFSIF